MFANALSVASIFILSFGLAGAQNSMKPLITSATCATFRNVLLEHKSGRLVGGVQVGNYEADTSSFGLQGFDIDITTYTMVAQCRSIAAGAPSCHIEVKYEFCTTKKPYSCQNCPVPGDRFGDAGDRRDLQFGRFDQFKDICDRTFSGSFFATGTGPTAYAITGGTNDFFAASGEWDGVFLNVQDPASDIDSTFKICFYSDESL